MSGKLKSNKERELTELNLQRRLKSRIDIIYGSIVWRRLQSGYRIEDLKPIHYKDVIEMIEKYYVSEDVFYKNSKFAEDKPSQKSFRERLYTNLKDECSIVAIEENQVCISEERDCICESSYTQKENAVAGVLLLKKLRKYDMGCVISKVHISEGKSYKSILNFVNDMNRPVDIFIHFDCDRYLRYYLLCIKPEYRRKGLGYQLMDVGFDVARHLNFPVVMGVFNCFKLQALAKTLGMQTLHEMEYVNWTDKHKQLVFCDLEAGSCTCALMAGLVPSLKEPESDTDLEAESKPTTEKPKKGKKRDKKKK